VATSGSVDFTSTRDELIKDALTLIRAIDPDEAVPSEKMVQSTRFFNRMVKTFQAQGLHLWTEAEAILFVDKGTRIYTFPTAYATDPEDFDDTTTSAAASSGDSTITVSAAGNIAVGDFLIIELDDGTRQKTTVGAISSTTITLPVGTTLTDDVASGNEVIAFTTKINRPLKVLSARRRISSVDSPLEVVSREEYVDLPNKTSTGLVNEIYYKPLVSTGELYLWPTGDTATERLSFTYQRPLEDFDSTSNNPDFPVEWHELLVSNLAFRLAPTYGTPPDIYQMVREQALMTYEMISGFDAEKTSVYINPR
jgi:hypothetical protein